MVCNIKNGCNNHIGFYDKIVVRGDAVPIPDMEVQRGNEGIVPLILKLDARWR
jgi:hypothetical protein